MDIAKLPFWNNKKFNPKDLFKNGEQGVWYESSDVDTYTSNLGPELTTNGTFDGNLTGWTNVGGVTNTLNASGNALITYSFASGGLFQDIPTTANIIKVVIRARMVQANVSLWTVPRTGNFNAPNTTTGITNNEMQDYTFYVYREATATGIRIYLNASTSGILEVESVSVKEVINIQNTCTLFQDSSGTIPVTSVEQPVGLMLDKRTKFSDELFTGTYSTGPVNTATYVGNEATVTFLGTPATIPSSSASWFTFPGASNPAYTVIEFWATYVSGGDLQVGRGFTVGSTITGVSNAGVRKLYKIGVFNVSTGHASVGRATFGATTNGSVWKIEIVSVKELEGNHAYQTTAIDRPILRRGIQNIQLHSNTYSRTLNNCTQSIATGEFIDGVQATRLKITANGNSTFVNSGNISIASGITYTMSSYVRQGTARYVQLTLPGAVFGVGQYANFDLQTGTITYSIGGTASILAVTGGYIISWSAVATSSASAGIGAVIIVNGPTSTRLETAIALAGQTIFIATTGVFVGAYTAYDIENKFGGIPITTTASVNTRLGNWYLACNGTNSWMRTNDIDFTATDEVNIFTGVRKLSDANVGMIVELSINSAANSGTFSLRGPQNPGGSGDFAFGTGGSNPTAALPNSAIQAPVSRVVTGIGKISADTAILRLNNIQVATSTADQSTGNYGTYPIFLFRRGGTSVPFNGNLYGLIIRGKLSTDKQIREIEKYFNKKILG